MDSSFLFTGGISVLALIVAFYSVILGTQRIPNFLSSIYILIKYAILYLVFVVFLMLLYETILKSRININENGLFFIQAGTFLIIVLSLGYFLLKEYHKVFSMRTYRHSWENFTILFPWSRKSQEKKTKYLERKQICEFCDNFLPTQKNKIINLTHKRSSDSLSIYYEIKNRIELDDTLVKIACWALKEGLNLLYLSCRRHPYEFLDLLKKEIEKGEYGQWENLKNQLLLVDAHTNHFGFKEPIYYQKTKLLKDMNIPIEIAKWSYVGIHSAVAHGYEKKLKIDERKHKASILLYDSCYALTDLESEKLYKIFLKHVIPSERSMGGNITIFIEQWVPDHIRCFAELAVDAIMDNETKKDKDNEEKV